MLYQFYQSYADTLAPWRGMAAAYGQVIARPWWGVPETGVQRGIAAAKESRAAYL